ncbi:MAG: thioesterase [Firmicutes bacterium]|nr:thioesterase [Bacillota bacterium]
MQLKTEHQNYLNYTQPIRITVNDCDFTQTIKPSAVMAYFQDIATEHATKIGIGYNDMKNKNLAWIMTSMCFKVFRNPTIGEELTIKTYPLAPKTAEAIRTYYICDKNDNIIISGSSRWCVIDINKRSITRCAPVFDTPLFNSATYFPTQPFDDANLRVSSIANEELKPINTYTVLPTDLDRNRHMNNTRYGDIFLNACGFDFINSHTINRFDINFVSELFTNDTVEVFKQENKLENDTKEIIVQAIKQNTNTTVFRARGVFSVHKNNIIGDYDYSGN